MWRIPVWTFVGLVTYVDILFACRHQSTLLIWESNPVAVFVYSATGIFGVISLRLAVTFFAYIMSQMKARAAFKFALTAFALGLHLYLAAVYAIIFLGGEVCPIY
jgi:hypothetical protein